MVLKLYSLPNAAGGSGIVALILLEKEITFQHFVMDLAKGDHKSSTFFTKQPFGEVPVIDDDGFILYESRAICRYLAEKYADRGPCLIPTDLKGKALFEQAASMEFANFYPQIMRVRTETYFKPRQGLPVDQAALAASLSDLSAKLDVYEVILEKQKFLAGNELTLADLFHLYAAALLAEPGLDIMSKQGPNVKRWWNDLTQRPAWIKLTAEGIKGTED
ncbi:glutathione S-transferase [Mycena vulgaris]|nr:glutathione S-transferase [Mycena vulgaris]